MSVTSSTWLLSGFHCMSWNSRVLLFRPYPNLVMMYVGLKHAPTNVVNSMMSWNLSPIVFFFFFLHCQHFSAYWYPRSPPTYLYTHTWTYTLNPSHTPPPPPLNYSDIPISLGPSVTHTHGRANNQTYFIPSKNIWSSITFVQLISFIVIDDFQWTYTFTHLQPLSI